MLRVFAIKNCDFSKLFIALAEQTNRFGRLLFCSKPHLSVQLVRYIKQNNAFFEITHGDHLRHPTTKESTSYQNVSHIFNQFSEKMPLHMAFNKHNNPSDIKHVLDLHRALRDLHRYPLQSKWSGSVRGNGVSGRNGSLSCFFLVG